MHSTDNHVKLNGSFSSKITDESKMRSDSYQERATLRVHKNSANYDPVTGWPGPVITLSSALLHESTSENLPPIF